MQSIASLLSIQNSGEDIGNLGDFDEDQEGGTRQPITTQDRNATSAKISELASKFGLLAAGSNEDLAKLSVVEEENGKLKDVLVFVCASAVIRGERLYNLWHGFAMFSSNSFVT